MTVRSWLIIGLVLQGLMSLVSGIQDLAQVLEHYPVLSADWLWVPVFVQPAVALGLILLRVQIAGWILGPLADKPAPMNHHDLVIVVAAFLGCELVLRGFGRVSVEVVGWVAQRPGMGPAPTAQQVAMTVERAGGVLGFYLREVWMAQFLALVAVLTARFMPRVMRLPPPVHD